MSIVWRFFALLVATLLLVAAGELVNTLNIREERLAETRRNMLQLAQIAALDMDHIVEGTRALLATLSLLPAKEGWDARACAVVIATAKSDLEYDHIAAVDRDGKILCASGSIRLGTVMSDRNLLDRVLANGEFTVGSYGVGMTSGNAVIRAAHPLVDAEGAVTGAIYAGINVSWLNAAIRQWQLPPEVSVNITDRNGVLVARYPDARWVGQTVPEGQRQLIARSEPGTAEAVGFDDLLRLYGYVPADIGAARGLAVFVGVSAKVAYARADRAIWVTLAIVGAGLLLAGIVTLFYAHRLLDLPFQRLLAAAAHWRSGDFSARAGSATGIPEFDRLGTAFDDMAAAVTLRDDSLKKQNDLLRAFAACAAELVSSDPLNIVIPRILKIVGEVVDVDRILVVEAAPVEGHRMLRHIWQSASVPVELSLAYFAAQPASFMAAMEKWLLRLQHGEVVATTRQTAPDVLRPIFDQLKIVSNLQAVILVEGKPWGQLAIDDCRTDRAWTQTEIEGLKALADMIGSAITRELQVEKLSNADEIVRNSPAILFRIGVAAGAPKLTFVSENIAILGHRSASLIADPGLFLSLIHPDDRPVTKAVLAAAIKGVAEGTFEVRVATASGAYRWLENRYTSTHDKQGRLIEVIGVLLDITERKDAEKNLQLANTILTTQSETSPDAILVIDVHQRILSSNRRFADMWRISPEALAAGDDKPLFEAVSSAMKDPVAFRARVQHLYEHPEESGNDELQTLDGRFIDRHTAGMRTPAGDYLGRVWFFRDVTERKQAQQALIESEIRFRTVLQATGDGILVVDVVTRKPVLGNQAICKMLGYRADELSGIEVNQIQPLADPPEREQRFDRIMAGENVLTSNMPIKRRDGSEFRADILTSPLVLEGRNYAVAVFRDVTERNRTETALRQERDFSTAVIDSLPGVFFVVNSKGSLIRYNKGLTVATGWSGTEPGRDLMKNIVPADREQAAAKMRETVERGHSETEIGLTDNGSGTVRRYLITSGQIDLSDGPGVLGIGVDVTEARRVEKQLKESDERFRTIFTSVSDGILLRDFDSGAILEANQSVCDMFGYTLAEILAIDSGVLSSGIAPYTGDEMQKRFAVARTGDSQTFEWHSKTKGGRVFFTEITLRKVVFGDRDYLLSTLDDISERKQNEERILQLARLDTLTGLPNRAVFAVSVQQAIARARRGGRGFAVLYLDLDHFKDINDTLGHPVGDALLKLVAERLKTNVRQMDTVARFGGDEFAILETDIGEPTDAGLLAGKILAALAAPFHIDGNEIRSGASIGIAVYGADSPDAEPLLSNADVALYRAKSEGRGTYRFFTDAMDAEVRSRVSLGNDLRAAIGTPQLFLDYQPQVESATGRIVGVEALARWRHPKRGIISPSEFIPAAEKNGLIVALGHWVLWEACRQAAEWRAAGIAPGIMAVNLSALQFKTPQELENDVIAALAATGLPAHMLELEITESVLMGASQSHNDVLVQLREMGVRLAIDDFGTGYSSLDYLRRFPMDRMKIAQEFVLHLGAESGSAAVVKATIGLAHELGIDLIAEGVETEEQLRLIESWGCREVQGYYFARPMSPQTLEPLLRAGIIVPAARKVVPAA